MTVRSRRWTWLLAVPLLLTAACSNQVPAPVPDEKPTPPPHTQGSPPAADKPIALARNEARAPEAEKSGASWPMYGGTIYRNLANAIEKNIAADWSIQKNKEKNVKWSARLGTMAYGGPVIAGGKVFVGTNNEHPRDPAVRGDKGVLMCFRESDGKFLWQAVHDKLDNPEENDYPRQGIASVPAVDGDRVYYVSNRCELVCADVEGNPATGKAKILWTLDMIKDLGVYPCQLANNSPLVVGDLVYTITANGVNPGTHKVVAPDAPSFVAVDKKTGKVVWKDNSPGANILEGQWSNPAAAEVAGVMHIIVPGGDGWLRGFEAKSGKLLWKFDCNPKKSVYKPQGRGDRCYVVATPVVWDNKVYVGVGLNPEDGPGVGHLWCIDLAKKPANKDLDLSPVNDNFDPKDAVNKDSGLVWHYGGPVLPKPADGKREFVFGRTLSTVAIHDGLLYAAELDGFLHCLDARTGKKHWDFDLKDGTWNSPYYVDGKVLIGVGSGDMLIFEHGPNLKPPRKIDMLSELKVPPVAVNGVLYVNNGTTLYAIAAR
jgi:outer membrane protein assembly factor BamB